MTPELRRVLVRIAFLLAFTSAGFVLAEQWMRGFETATTVDLLHALRVPGIGRDSPTSILIHAPSADNGLGDIFSAELTPSCSSLASLLAIAGLAVLRPPASRPRLAAAVLAAMTFVFVGNILRIAASVGMGVVAGRASLVLFHDWVGSMFGFAYTLGGFLVMLWFLLPRDGIPLSELCSDRAPRPAVADES
jgi:exosortase/archaeosortase family protein